MYRPPLTLLPHSQQANDQHCQMFANYRCMAQANAERTRNVAIVKAQRWWRMTSALGRTTKRILHAFNASGLKMADVGQLEFAELNLKLSDKNLQHVMKRAVLRIFYLSYGRKGFRGIANANLNISVFLSAYMIHFHTSHVFGVLGDLESQLTEASKPMLESFHAICEETSGSGSMQQIPRDITDPFPDHLKDFVVKYKAWKIADEARLGERIKAGLTAIYEAEAVMPIDEPRRDIFLAEFKRHQDRLQYRLMKVCGQRVLRDFDLASNRGHLPLPTAPASPR
jgi:hypothetical protein